MYISILCRRSSIHVSKVCVCVCICMLLKEVVVVNRPKYDNNNNNLNANKRTIKVYKCKLGATTTPTT